MKLRVDFSALEAAVRQMGATPVAFSVHVATRPLDRIDAELAKGIELPDLEDVELSGGLLSYKGRQILLYIRSHDGKVQAALADGKKGNKFHVADCKTLQNMRSRGRFERYVVTNKLDGLFHIEGKDWKTGAQEEGEARLWVCQNCLKQLNYKGANYGGAYEQARDFDIEEFFANYSSYFRYLPSRNAEDGEQEGYAEDWREISRKYKEARDFSCEACGVDLTAHKNLLHVHHVNGVKSDNKPSNLRVLCLSCHREQPSHGHMFVPHKDTQTITRLRREQGLLKSGDWKKAFSLCDPALHGVLDACSRARCPVPEVGLDVQNAKGVVVATLELAWEAARVGVAIADEDREAAANAGWTVLDSVAIINEPKRFVEKLQQRHPARRR